jgi:hypothetical protein
MEKQHEGQPERDQPSSNALQKPTGMPPESHAEKRPQAEHAHDRRDISLLRRSVNNAYYLHNYSVTIGKDVPEEVSTTIIEFKQLFDRDDAPSINTDDEVRFSAAYRELAALMWPVTVESLRDTEDVNFSVKRSFFRRFRLSRAQQVTFLLPIVAILLILSILACEIIQSIFIPGLRDIDLKEQQWEEASQQFLDNPTSAGLEDQMEELDNDIKALLKNLRSSWDNLPILPKLSVQGALGENWIEDQTKVNLVKTRLEIAIEILNRILPILYGALGSTAYFLRVLIPHIRNRTFNKKHSGSISVRICLGMLSGIAIQWFFVDTAAQQQMFHRSLSSSALAFLAGYSVDILFNIMDKFIQGFKSPSQTELVPCKPDGRQQQKAV